MSCKRTAQVPVPVHIPDSLPKPQIRIAVHANYLGRILTLAKDCSSVSAMNTDGVWTTLTLTFPLTTSGIAQATRAMTAILVTQQMILDGVHH